MLGVLVIGVVAVGIYALVMRYLSRPTYTCEDIFPLAKAVRGRKLTCYESLYHNLHTVCGSNRLDCVIMLKGNISAEDVRQTFIQLQKKHPGLRRGIHQAQDGTLEYHEYLKPELLISLGVIERRNDNHFRQVWCDALNTYRFYFGFEKLMWSAKFLHNPLPGVQQHEIIFSSAHSFIDGTGIAILAKDVLDTLACLKKEKSSPQSESDYPRLEHLLQKSDYAHFAKKFPWYYNYLPAWIVSLHQLEQKIHQPLPLEKEATLNQRKDACVGVRLKKSDYTSFVQCCKREGVTVHSGLCGILSTVVKTACKLENGFKLGISTPASMRRYFGVPDDCLGVFIGFYVPAVVIKEANSIWDYAREIGRQNKANVPQYCLWNLISLTSGLPTVEKMAGAILKEKLINKNSGRTGTVLLSNMGRLDPKRFPSRVENVELVGLHLSSSARGHKEQFQIFVYTWGEEMFFSFQWAEPMMSEVTAKGIIAQFLQHVKTCK